MSIPAILKKPSDLYARLSNIVGSREEFEAELAHISYSNGLMTAVAVTSETIPLSEWLPLVFDFPGESAEDAELATEVALLEYGEVRDSLRAAEYEPFFWTDEKGRVITRDWAEGFLAGVNLRTDLWASRLDEQNQILPVVIGALLQEDTLNASIKETGVEPEELSKFAQGSISEIVQALYALSEDNAREHHGTMTHPDKKIGRNDPCPCGSGKKYKKCCLS